MKRRPRKLFLILIGLIPAAVLPLPGQFHPGQYTDEAPFRTWNSFPYAGAAAAGRGHTVFAWATDASSTSANPALLLTLPKATVALGGSFQWATAMRYGPVNSGLLIASSPIGGSSFTGDHAVVSLRAGRFAFAAGVFLSEIYDRPGAEVYDNENQARLYTIRFTQTGLLRTFHLAAAFQLSPRLGLGAGVNAAAGRLTMELMEDLRFLGFNFTSAKSSSLKGLSINGGIFWDISPSLRAALTFRSPFTLEAGTETVDRYAAPEAGTEIIIRGESADSFKRPLAVGAGFSIRHSDRFRTALDVAWTRWSSYEAVWLGDAPVRDFRDTVRVSAGGEFLSTIRIFRKKVKAPFRFSLIYDPQPPARPRSAYWGIAAGAGLAIDGFRIDLGGLIGTAQDAGDRLTSARISLSCGYAF